MILATEFLITRNRSFGEGVKQSFGYPRTGCLLPGRARRGTHWRSLDFGVSTVTDPWEVLRANPPTESPKPVVEGYSHGFRHLRPRSRVGGGEMKGQAGQCLALTTRRAGRGDATLQPHQPCDGQLYRSSGSAAAYSRRTESRGRAWRAPTLQHLWRTELRLYPPPTPNVDVYTFCGVEITRPVGIQGRCEGRLGCQDRKD